MLRRVVPTLDNINGPARLVGDWQSPMGMGTRAAVDARARVGVPSPYIPYGFEKGSAAWDIGQALTRHNIGGKRARNGHDLICARVIELRRTALTGIQASVRLSKALAVPCTCGAGNSLSEQSSLTNKESQNVDPTFRTSAFRL